MAYEVVYEVVSTYHHPGSHMDGSSMSSGCYWSHDAALARLGERQAWLADRRAETPAPTWTYSWRIDAIDQRGLFQVPPRPMPRERYSTREARTSEPNAWTLIDVDVLNQTSEVVGSYHRNYSLLKTFEPFRQDGRDYALISPNYTATSVMDLRTGAIVAAEPVDGHGFCPVGFYVPDWWDVNKVSEGGNRAPGSLHWSTDDEWPTGNFGFVFGCVWGDDSTYKLQYLDLSRVADGEIHRDDRFGYVEVADNAKLDFKDLITLERYDGEVRVTVSSLRRFDLDDGHSLDE